MTSGGCGVLHKNTQDQLGCNSGRKPLRKVQPGGLIQGLAQSYTSQQGIEQIGFVRQHLATLWPQALAPDQHILGHPGAQLGTCLF